VEQCRWLRARALELGLDPDSALPEDIMLLDRDRDGNLAVAAEYDRAERWVRQLALNGGCLSQILDWWTTPIFLPGPIGLTRQRAHLWE
jgi:hypothetical protein